MFVFLLLLIIILMLLVYCFSKDTFKGDNLESIYFNGPKVLTISCYGYGNIGDNMYSEVFANFLNECEIVKISDHGVFVDSNKKFHKKIPETDYNFDYLIIGGGGILTSKKLRDSSVLNYYIKLAMQNNRPIYIISCGVQGKLDNFENDFSMWKPVFDYASLITVRSPNDKNYIDSITDPRKVFYFRDLGYLYPRIANIRKYTNNEKILTLIVAGPVHDKNKEIVDIIKNYDKIIIMNMGAITDDENNKRMLNMNFPGAKNTVKYYGSGRAKEFNNNIETQVNQTQMEEMLRSDKVSLKNPTDLSTEKAVEIIYNSSLVLTGRYHGMIFARSLGIPCNTLGMNTNKVKWELPINSLYDTIISSYQNIKLLRESMGLHDRTYEDYEKLFER